MIDLTDTHLEERRARSDDVADQVVATILERHDLDAVNRLFRSLISNHHIPGDLPPEALAYFRSTGQLPAGVDLARLEIGQQVFTKVGPQLFVVLFCKSLPECYACWRGAEVLYRTGRITQQTPDFRRYSRRLMETAQFVLDVLTEGGLGEGGRGIVTVQKIRLIHASIRHYLMAGDWDLDTYGVPINQEDEAGTLMMFSIAVLQGLETLGVELSAEEKSAYLYTWCLVGNLLGLPPELIPADLDEAAALRRRILEHQGGPSEAGRVLTRSCIDYMAYLTPGTLFDPSPEALIRFLVDEPVARALGVADDPLPERDRALINIYEFFNREMTGLEDHSALVRGASRFFERHLLEGIFRHYGHLKGFHFYIPPSLQGRWGLEA